MKYNNVSDDSNCGEIEDTIHMNNIEDFGELKDTIKKGKKLQKDLEHLKNYEKKTH